MKTSILTAIEKNSGNVKSNVNSTTLLIGFYLSRELPFNYLDLNNAVSFDRTWNSLESSARALCKEIPETIFFSEDIAVHYARQFFQHRATLGFNVWFQLYNTYGMEFFNTPDDEMIGSILVTGKEKAQLIHYVSSVFTENEVAFFTNGRVSMEKLSVDLDTLIPYAYKKSTRDWFMKEGLNIIKTCMQIQRWSSGERLKLNEMAKPFLRDMFNSVVLNCVSDDSLLDFVIETSCSTYTFVSNENAIIKIPE